MPLTNKQKEYLLHYTHRWNFKGGATGSGKTFMDICVTIPKRLMATRGEGLIVLMGNTRGTLAWTGGPHPVRQHGGYLGQKVLCTGSRQQKTRSEDPGCDL